jgi:predicted nuclease of restriction endonuclease-like (RecB) superfamily
MTAHGNEFFNNVAKIIEQARVYVGRTADLTMCVTYFEVGRMIVEEEQGGKARAEYGRGLLKELSAYLNERVGKGFSESTLRNARKFYQVYAPAIQQTAFAELQGKTDEGQKQQTLFAESEKSQTAFSQSYPFTLSWSHYLILMRIKNTDERRFYEIEAARQQWTFRQLQRQYGSSLYERLALSRDKDAVMRLAKEGQTLEKPRDMLKNPLVLEFLGMEERSEYSENDLETAIINKLQMFLLELGKGFLFEARQKRFTFNEQHFMVDLVFYNRLLKCYVLIDLKTGILKHQDLGQMQMYVHYFDRYIKTDDEHPSVGILLCQEKDDAIVELTLPEGENIYASEYSLYLPDKALLQQKLAEWTREFEEALEAQKAATIARQPVAQLESSGTGDKSDEV